MIIFLSPYGANFRGGFFYNHHLRADNLETEIQLVLVAYESYVLSPTTHPQLHSINRTLISEVCTGPIFSAQLALSMTAFSNCSCMGLAHLFIHSCHSNKN